LSLPHQKNKKAAEAAIAKLIADLDGFKATEMPSPRDLGKHDLLPTKALNALTAPATAGQIEG